LGDRLKRHSSSHLSSLRLKNIGAVFTLLAYTFNVFWAFVLLAPIDVPPTQTVSVITIQLVVTFFATTLALLWRRAQRCEIEDGFTTSPVFNELSPTQLREIDVIDPKTGLRVGDAYEFEVRESGLRASKSVIQPMVFRADKAKGRKKQNGR
jgi:hypothetical protein